MRITWEEFEERFGEKREEHADIPQCPECCSYNVRVSVYGIECIDCEREEEEDDEDEQP